MFHITINYNEEYKKVYIPTCIEYSKIIHSIYRNKKVRPNQNKLSKYLYNAININDHTMQYIMILSSDSKLQIELNMNYTKYK